MRAGHRALRAAWPPLLLAAAVSIAFSHPAQQPAASSQELTLYRDGRKMQLKVKLESAPQEL